MERTAECHCGQLRAIASRNPDLTYVCHCKACQRRTGAVVHSGAYYLKSQVRFEGASQVYDRGVDSGFKIRFHFCPNCGSNVYWHTDRYPDHCGVAVGAFADPEFPVPSLSVFEEAMHRWVSLPIGIEHFTKGRPVGIPVKG